MTRYSARVTWPNSDAPAFLDVYATDANRARFAVLNALLNGPYPAGWHIREVVEAAAGLEGEA